MKTVFITGGMRRFGAPVVVLWVVLVALVGSTPARAGSESGSPPPLPTNGSGGSANVNDCGVYSSHAGYGVACRRTETVAQILNGDPVPAGWCNYVALAAGQPVPPGHVGEVGGWWWRVCLNGIQLDQPIIHDNITVTTFGPFWFPQPPGPPKLTVNQLDVWNWGYGSWPAAQVEFAPSARPRVGVPTLIALVPGTYDAPERTGVDQAGETILVKAGASRLDVWPDGTGTNQAAPVSCAGPGRPWSAGMQLNAPPADACTFTYSRSSATQSGGLYPAVVQIDWLTQYSTDNGVTWNALPVVSMSQTVDVEVDDVQGIDG